MTFKITLLVQSKNIPRTNFGNRVNLSLSLSLSHTNTGIMSVYSLAPLQIGFIGDTFSFTRKFSLPTFVCSFDTRTRTRTHTLTHTHSHTHTHTHTHKYSSSKKTIAGKSSTN